MADRATYTSIDSRGRVKAGSPEYRHSQTRAAQQTAAASADSVAEPEAVMSLLREVSAEASSAFRENPRIFGGMIVDIRARDGFGPRRDVPTTYCTCSIEIDAETAELKGSLRTMRFGALHTYDRWTGREPLDLSPTYRDPDTQLGEITTIPLADYTSLSPQYCTALCAALQELRKLISAQRMTE